MRVLWVKAPFVLRRHPPVLLAVILMSALAALAAAATPIVRAGVQSESLKRELGAMTPLTAGLEVTSGGTLGKDPKRRKAAVELASRVKFFGRPVIASYFNAQFVGTASPGFGVLPMTRVGAIAHVTHVHGPVGQGVWVPDNVAHGAHLHVGDTLGLTEHVFVGTSAIARVRIAGIYHSLEIDRDNPYWANWAHEIRPQDPNDDPPPPFVLMDRGTFDRVARVLSPYAIEDRFELPVDPQNITFTGAQKLNRRITELRTEIERPGSPLERALECNPAFCRTSSSLTSAMTIASADVAAVGPTIFLLSACGVLIALGLSIAAGLFLVRRRGDEAHVLFARGESPAAFGARTALEGLLPVLLGLALGLGIALLALGALAPKGTISTGTVTAGGIRAVLASLAALACIAGGAVSGFPRRGGEAHDRHWRRIPWEVVPLAVGIGLLVLVIAGHGLAHDETGATHPRLVVFFVPVLIVAGVAGVLVRALRWGLRGRGATSAVVFLALRRLATARGLLVAVIVASSTAFGTFAYASTLSTSLERSTTEKAFVANGGDVQGYIDPAERLLDHFDFPVALVQTDQFNVSFPSGARVDLIAGDPENMRRAIVWSGPDDPRPLIPRIAHSQGNVLDALATPDAPNADAIVDQGMRIPIRIVGRTAFPGTTPGRPAVIVSWPALRRIGRHFHIADPGPLATGLLWAKGDPKVIEPALAVSTIAPAYLTTSDKIYTNVSVSSAARSYRYVRLIGAAAAVLSLIALLLYLQARQRSLLIASALVRRMGFGAAADAAAVALEAGAIVFFAAIAGAAVAVAAARPITHRLDSLPQYSPPPGYFVPWHTLIVAVFLATAVAAACGAIATLIAQRSDVSEALRVA